MAPVKIAVVGVGSLGSIHIRELLKFPDLYIPIAITSSKTTLLPASQVRVIDYSSPSSLASAVQGVHTIINTAFPSASSIQEFLAGQLRLIQAADEAGVKRYIPSEWAMNKKVNQYIQLYGFKDPIMEALRKTKMEFTAVRPGIYMNFFAFGSPKERVVEDAFDGVRYNPYVVNIEDGTANNPGTGNDLVTFTKAQEIAVMTVKLLALEKWEEESGVVGSTMSYNEVIKLAEKLTGKKFNVTYIPKEQLEAQKAELEKGLPETLFQHFVVEGFLAAIKLGGDASVKPTLNQRLGNPKLTTVEEFLQRWWA
ncbi:NAD(P)-binding protein [Atractiella rhizophila]|nr:NAD(P)-binding protein [Atractiella rhizophila]